MSYRELFVQSWQLVRHNKRIWFFSFWSTVCAMVNPLFYSIGLRFPGLKIYGSFFVPLYCLAVIFGIAYAIFACWSLYGQFYCTALAVNGAECDAAAVWKNFKSNLLKMAFLFILILIYFFILYGLNNLVWKGIISIAGNFYGADFWWSVSLGVWIIFLGAPVGLSLYGLIFQRMGVFASFINGLGVFSKDPMTFIGIQSAHYFAVLAGGLIALVTLLFLGQNINYDTYNRMRSAVPITMLTSFCSFFIAPVVSTAMASRYFKISPIRE